MSVTLILGAGAMGSAFSVPLADARGEVRLVGSHLDDDIIDSLRHMRAHPALRVELPGSVRVYRYEQLEEALVPEPSLIVLGVSSPGVDWAVDALRRRTADRVPVLVLTKGLRVDGARIVPLTEVVERGLARDGFAVPRVGGVGGPCIAAELAARRDSSVVVASPYKTLLAEIEAIARTPYYHLRTTDDVIGLEASAALKNFFAIAVGAAAGILDRDDDTADGPRAYNPEASLFAQALSELRYLVRYLGGRIETVDGLAGAGDLFVTCRAGRNSRMGRLLGAGLTFREAKSEHMPKVTVEGADLALEIGPAIENLLAQGEFAPERLPLTTSLIDAICRDALFEPEWDRYHTV